MKETEGHVAFRGYRTWYRAVGEPREGSSPLLCLHGGPGSSHAYFERLERLAEDGRQVVVYDQLGCGDSDRPDDPSLWSVELFVEEVDAVREALGLDRVHVLGTSWGGMLALEYALTQPAGLCSLVLSSTLASTEEWLGETRRLLAELGPGAGEAEFEAAHFCRLDPRPPEVALMKAKRNKALYELMWGPNEWTCTGVLAGWDVRDRLDEIRLPTIVLHGAYDECTDTIARTLVDGIAGAERHRFEHSSHTPVLEETDRYLEVVGSFLDRVEAR